MSAQADFYTHIQVCIGARIKSFGDRPIHYSSGSVKYLVGAD